MQQLQRRPFDSDEGGNTVGAQGKIIMASHNKIGCTGRRFLGTLWALGPSHNDAGLRQHSQRSL